MLAFVGICITFAKNNPTKIKNYLYYCKDK
jgi:hypothetical protein